MAALPEPEPLAYLRSAGIVYELEDPVTTVGRAPDNNIVLNKSKSISSHHARIVIEDASNQVAKLVDVGSLNGSFVNDARVTNGSLPLRSLDMVKFGYDTATYRFEFPSDHKAPMPADYSRVPPHLRESASEARTFRQAAGLKDHAALFGRSGEPLSPTRARSASPMRSPSSSPARAASTGRSGTAGRPGTAAGIESRTSLRERVQAQHAGESKGDRYSPVAYVAAGGARPPANPVVGRQPDPLPPNPGAAAAAGASTSSPALASDNTRSAADARYESKLEATAAPQTRPATSAGAPAAGAPASAAPGAWDDFGGTMGGGDQHIPDDTIGGGDQHIPTGFDDYGDGGGGGDQHIPDDDTAAASHAPFLRQASHGLGGDHLLPDSPQAMPPSPKAMRGLGAGPKAATAGRAASDVEYMDNTAAAPKKGTQSSSSSSSKSKQQAAPSKQQPGAKASKTASKLPVEQPERGFTPAGDPAADTRNVKFQRGSASGGGSGNGSAELDKLAAAPVTWPAATNSRSASPPASLGPQLSEGRSGARSVSVADPRDFDPRDDDANAFDDGTAVVWDKQQLDETIAGLRTRNTLLERANVDLRQQLDTTGKRGGVLAICQLFRTRQQAALQRAWSKWTIAALRGSVAAAHAREDALVTAVREQGQKLDLLMTNDWARELVRQQAEIETLRKDVADAEERMLRNKLDFAASVSGTKTRGGGSGPATPSAVSNAELYPNSPHPAASAYTKRLVDTAVSDAVAMASMEWNDERSKLLEMVAERDRQLYRLAQAIGQVAGNGDSKRRQAAELLVAEVQRLQSRDVQALTSRK